MDKDKQKKKKTKIVRLCYQCIQLEGKKNPL